ncbi:TCF3 fusion partner like protein [Myotis davidii]|uniref:TCF3 fusion partner like protein n=1 Tax=Myotis davidii TaxID=225400 RepID=L5MI94_MYODS|nr:TCF3 fusion partner like protein [Myotis davidii]
MELEHREGTMAPVGFEEFSAPPGSELALPLLFGDHILKSETEVEFMSGVLGSSSFREQDEEEEAARGQQWHQREHNRRSTRRWVQRITRRLQQEWSFLKRVLDSYGDNYRASQFTILLEDEGSQGTDAPTPGNAENEPPKEEGLSPPKRMPAPTEARSQAPGEGSSGQKGAGRESH